MKALAKFLADTEAQVAALSERGKELEERARELFVYFGEEPRCVDQRQGGGVEGGWVGSFVGG